MIITNGEDVYTVTYNEQSDVLKVIFEDDDRYISEGLVVGMLKEIERLRKFEARMLTLSEELSKNALVKEQHV